MAPKPKPKGEQPTQLDTSKHVDPNVDPAKESTPIADQLERELADGELEDDDDEDELEEAPETAKAYKVDVKRALQRSTDDGKGDEDPGESDFISYATEGVEREDED